jgi:hypothetical protein
MKMSRYPEFVSERLSAVENIQHTWAATAVLVAALALAMSLIQ